MIIWGWRSKVLEGKPVDNIPCPACGNTGHHTYGVFRYFHLYFIPTIAYGLKSGTICDHCRLNRLTGDSPDLTPEARAQVRGSTLPARRMLPYYAGVLVIAALVLTGIVTTSMADTRDTAALGEPHRLDIYAVRDTVLFPGDERDLPYKLLKVMSVSGDTVTVSPGKYVYSSSRGVEKALREQASEPGIFMGLTKVVRIADLARMKANGDILGVSRAPDPVR